MFLKESRVHYKKTEWRAWKTELQALAWSVLSFAVMVVLLAIFDGRPVFDWKLVTLNAIIAVVSVSMKASLTFAVSELIGQWKWILFSRESRPLMDFERIDMASRGPLGSFRILCRMNGLWPLQLGGLIIVLAIGLEPFSQQLLQLRQGTEFSEGESYEDSHSAFTKRVEEYTKGDTIITNETASTQNPPGNSMITVTAQLELAMQTAILSGLSRSQKEVTQQAAVQCPTGICSWDQFQTLGVCSRCNDLTSNLKRVNNFGRVFDAVHEADVPKADGTAFVLPNGHFLMNINECDVSLNGDCFFPSPSAGYTPGTVSRMTSFGTGDPRKTNTMKDVNTLIWSMSIIDIDINEFPSETMEWPNVPLRATECALYYCIKTIETRVEGNIIHENVTEATDAVRGEDSWSISVSTGGIAPENIPPDNKNATLEFNELYSCISRDDLVLHFPSNSRKPQYKVFDKAVWSISHFIQGLFSTNLTQGHKVTVAISEVQLPNDDPVRYNGAIENERSRPAAVENIWDFKKRDIPNTFATLAISMTNGLRAPDSYTSSFDTDVYGRIGRPTKYYKTQWGWIVLHGLVLMGGVYFWWVTVQNTARPPDTMPPWRNSSLAVINKGPTALVDVFRGADETIAQMERRAQEQKVKMAVDETSIDEAQENGDGTHLMQAMNVNESDSRSSG